jgi:transcriptional regulator with PAS, ATPase and Fis domain
VEINCAAILPTLLEAELFGYEKGAYTDAKTAKPGLFEAADGGTIFLDEIGYTDPAMQVKLLKVIEEKSIRRMGSLRSKTINTRIISATNRDLKEAIAEGGFRPDLYYRLNVLAVDMPSLRERGADIILLARYFLDRFTKQYGRPPKQLTAEAESLLQSYTWPGNVRELAHVMERAAILPTGPTLAAEQLNLSTGKSKAPVVVGRNGNVSADFSEGGIVLDNVERELIVKALDASGWNRTQASELLGISRDTLRYRMEKHQLQHP